MDTTPRRLDKKSKTFYHKSAKTILNVMYPILTVVAMIAVWQIAAAAIDEVLILPSPITTVKEIFTLFTLKSFWIAFVSTLTRSLYGFLLSFIVAAILSVSAALVEPLKRLYAPLIGFLRSLPTVAAVLILSVWTSAKTATVIIALLIIMPTLYASFYSAIHSADPKLVTMSRVFKVSKQKQIAKLYLPHAIPIAASSCAGAISLNIKLVIAAEILTLTSKSLGSQMLMAKNYLEIPTLLALNLIAAITGMLLEYGLSALLNILMKRRKYLKDSKLDAGTDTRIDTEINLKTSKEIETVVGKATSSGELANIKASSGKAIELSIAGESCNKIILGESAANIKTSSGKAIELNDENLNKKISNGKTITLKNVTKKFGDKVIYDELNLALKGGEITAVMGASGCGKTTLLNMMAGLEEFGGEIEGVGKCSYIFQEARLIPYMTARQNIFYAVGTDADKLLQSVGLGDALNTYADNLSIGMAQRVSFARAFALYADVVLMDEPFRGLDISLKSKLMSNFKALWDKDRRACIMVTHETDEAIELSDRIIVFKDGKVILDNRQAKNPMTEKQLREFLISKT